ncbi:MAG: DUF4214 domain-containing protein [Pseudomonadota bacterium]
MRFRSLCAAVAAAFTLVACGGDAPSTNSSILPASPTSESPVEVLSGARRTMSVSPVYGLAGARSEYTVTQTASGLQVQSNTPGSSPVTVHASAHLRFVDTTVAYGTESNAARAYRIYQAAFNRVPDGAGLGFWLKALDSGSGLDEVAASLMKSEEFIGMYGATSSNADLVARFYYNVLNRPGEAAGLRFWIDVLDRKLVTQATVLSEFSESAENKARVLPAITTGIAYHEAGIQYDSDNDGVHDGADVAPNDAACSTASNARNGVCIAKILAQHNATVIGSAAGKAYFLSNEDTTRMYSFDMQSRTFLGSVAITGYVPTKFVHVPAHGRIYVGEASGKIHSYSEAMQEVNANFINVGTTFQGMTAAGKYLIVGHSGGAYTFDSAGIQKAQGSWWYRSLDAVWDAASSRLYSLSSGISPADLNYSVIDQATGNFTSSGETPYHGSYSIMGPVRVSASGAQVLLGSGDVYTAPALTWGGNLGAGSFTEAAWLSNNEVITLSPSGAQTKLIRFSATKAKVEELRIDGTVIHVSVNGSNNYLIVKKPGQIEVINYVASDDSDRDGVNNLIDKFPLDRTAAVDTDNDGYPDAFLNGYTSADSTTGLTRDFYPNDASCHALEQGDGTQCNYGLVIPSYTPDKVLSDDAGTIFMLSKKNNRVYRWSQVKGDYIAPLVIGQKTDLTVTAPATMTYSKAHKRLYFGYSSGLVTYIDLAGDLVETRFTAVGAGVGGIGAAGEFVLIEDASGAWETHSIFNKDGVMTDSKDWNYYSDQYEWNALQSRIYFYRSNTSPGDLHYETIDQTTGKITSSGETPYHGTYSFYGPIRVSTGGTRIVIGSGVMFNTSDLNFVKTVGATHIDAQWLDSGSLYTIAANGIDTKVSTYDSSLNYLKAVTFLGKPTALMKSGTSLIVVTHDGSKPKFSVYKP